MTTTFNGQLEIDSERGVIYFHLAPEEIDKFDMPTVTLLRICNLPTPIPTDRSLDITNGFGVNWQGKKPKYKLPEPIVDMEEEIKITEDML